MTLLESQLKNKIAVLETQVNGLIEARDKIKEERDSLREELAQAKEEIKSLKHLAK